MWTRGKHPHSATTLLPRARSLTRGWRSGRSGSDGAGARTEDPRGEGDRAPPAAARGRAEHWDATSLPGFGVRVTPNGRKSFILISRLRAKAIRYTIGYYPQFSLVEVREHAKEAIQMMALGEDPRERRRQRKICETTGTFKGRRE